MAAIYADPHVAAREMLVEVEQPDGSRPVTLAGQPIKMTGRHTGVRRPPAAARRTHRRDPRRGGVATDERRWRRHRSTVCGSRSTQGIATLWLDRPAKRNAVTYDMWIGIAAHCERLAADDAVRLLVVRGAGDHFCAGADIAGMGDVSGGAYKRANEAADAALAAFPKPSIAVITGACVGGGTEIAVACDLRLADTTSRFGITPARLGIVYPASATARVVRLIGPSATKHLLFSAELIDAERALRIGLVDEVHDPAVLADRVRELTVLMAGERSLLTQMASKEIVDSLAADDRVDPEVEERWSRVAAAGSDPAEGVAAFVERRRTELHLDTGGGAEMTDRMTALVGGVGPQWERREVDVPVPRPGQLLVRVRAAGLNRADLRDAPRHVQPRPSTAADVHRRAGAGRRGRRRRRRRRRVGRR